MRNESNTAAPAATGGGTTVERRGAFVRLLNVTTDSVLEWVRASEITAVEDGYRLDDGRPACYVRVRGEEVARFVFATAAEVIDAVSQ